MKKIIYSLVIMIAAGSLFTSCIEQVEPVGLLDMRTAKAEYIRALKDLRAADAEYTRAKAAVEQANARYRDAETAFKNAQVENQKLLNDLQSLWNEATAQENVRRAAEIAAEIEGIEMKMEELAAEHAIKMVQYEAQLAQAQETLRTVLRDIAIASKSLSPNEKLAVIESAALVAVLSDAQVAALKEVNEAQKELDTLMFQAFKANNVWDEGFLEGAEEHWQEKIEEQQAVIAIAEIAKSLVPLATAQISEWQDIVDGYVQDSLEIAQEEAEQTYAVTAYWNTTVQPGIVKFNKAIADFIEENWEEEDGEFVEPSYTPLRKEPTAPKPGQTTYKSTVPGSVEKEYFTTKDSLVLPNLAQKEEEISWFTWARFAYLLNDYFTTPAKGSKADPKNTYLTFHEGLDTIFWGPVAYSEKNYIMGKKDQAPADDDETIGLWGAYSVLARDLVVAEQEKDDDIEQLQQDVDSLTGVWTIHRNILKEGLAKFEPYKEALATKAEKDSLLTVAKNQAKTDSAALISTAKALYTIFAELAQQHEWTTRDSSDLLDLIVAYAAARDNYFGTTDTITVTPYPYAPYKNPHYFYYSRTAVEDVRVIDSVKFSELKTIPAYYYEFDMAGNRRSHAPATHYYSPHDYAVNWQTSPAMVQAFVNIIGQLFDGETVEVEYYDYASSPYTCKGEIELNPDRLTAAGQETYGKYYLISEEIPAGGLYINDWSVAKPKLMPENVFVPAYVEAAETAAALAAEGVEIAEGKYAAIYEAFWNAEYPTDPEAEELDPTIYTLETFKDYEDGSPVILFEPDGDVLPTRALRVIVASVNPSFSSIYESEILGGWEEYEGTDLYNWALAKYALYTATTDLDADLVAIEKWVKAVDAKFDSSQAKAVSDAQAAYAKDHSDWEKEKAADVAKKAAWDAYVAKKKAFVGERIEGTDTLMNELFITDEGSVTKGEVNFVLTTGMEKAAFENALFATNVYGDLVGWTKNLGGQQLANAKEAFGEKPYEQIQDWKVARNVNNKKQETLHVLKEKAEAVFVEKAKVEGIADPDATSLASIQAAWDAYVTQLDGVITAANTAIEGYAEKLAAVVGGNIGWDYLIKDAEINLAAAEAKLEDITKMLEKAQSNLDKIMEYIRSTDAEFVIPVTIEEIDALINNLQESGLGASLKALIAAYMGGADEEEDGD